MFGLKKKQNSEFAKRETETLKQNIQFLIVILHNITILRNINEWAPSMNELWSTVESSKIYI